MTQEIKRIALEGVHNTRDLGGYSTLEGRRIKTKRLIRSGELSKLTERDKHILTEDYQLSVIVDFRTHTECMECADPALQGVVYVSNPILEEKALGITREKEAENDVVSMVLGKMKGNKNAGIEYMENMYRNFITTNFTKKQYGKFLHIVLENRSGSVLWHCTAGKDRAGIGTALLLAALGISKEQIVADYMKVNEFAADEINLAVQNLVEKTGDRELGEHLRTLFSVQESYIYTFFDTINQGYGSVERFLKEEMSLYEDALQELKYNYLEG